MSIGRGFRSATDTVLGLGVRTSDQAQARLPASFEVWLGRTPLEDGDRQLSQGCQRLRGVPQGPGSQCVWRSSCYPTSLTLFALRSPDCQLQGDLAAGRRGLQGRPARRYVRHSSATVKRVADICCSESAGKPSLEDRQIEENFDLALLSPSLPASQPPLL